MPLYDDIGCATAVRATLDAFYPRVLKDVKLSPFFDGVDIERLKRIQEGFFAMGLGGPNDYKGRSLDLTHTRARQRGMDDGSFDRFLDVFRGVLIDLCVPAEKIGKPIKVFERTRAQVLHH